MPEAFPRVLSRAAAQQGCRSERSGAGEDGRFHGCQGADFFFFQCFFSVLYEKIFIVVIQTQMLKNYGTFFFPPYTFFFFFFPLDRDKGPRAHWEEACMCALQGCCNGVRNKA